MFFRLQLMFLISRLHSPFPPDFDLSAAPHPPCRIFNRSAFSQQGCGACTAFAVSTAVAVRECVRRGRDVIPSPHRLFDCGGGDCNGGAFVGTVVDVLNWGAIEDVDDAVAMFGVECNYNRNDSGAVLGIHHTMGLPHWYSAYYIHHDDALMIKAELFMFGNPVLAVFEPDREMMSYSTENRARYNIKWKPPLPVYHITGTPLRAHVVVVLGWGSEPEPHWVVQNSWGEAWGDHGRGRIAMDDLMAAAVLDYGVWKTNWIMLFSSILLTLVIVVEFGPEARCCWRRLFKRGVGLKEKVDDGEGCVEV